jgi:hypothetical protein
MNMSSNLLALTLLSGVALLSAGCHSDRPHEYGRQRPPVDQLDPRDRGLQSKDVVSASDQMTMDLLSSPQLNSSRTQWVMVVDRVENRTVSARFDMDIFLRRLRVNLANQGQGRVQLIENRAKLQELQSRELDSPRDDFGQGGIPRPPAGRLQPDYSLYARISELPGRGTSYFFLEFTVTDLHTGTQPWTNAYEVRAER